MNNFIIILKNVLRSEKMKIPQGIRSDLKYNQYNGLPLVMSFLLRWPFVQSAIVCISI